MIKKPMIKIEDNEENLLDSENIEVEVTHVSAIKAVIILSILVFISFIVLYSIDRYNNLANVKHVYKVINSINILMDKDTPQFAGLFENYEFDLLRYREEFSSHKRLASDIDSTLSKLYAHPSYVFTGNQYRSWFSGELIKNELDSIIVQYSKRKNYSVKIVYQPLSNIEVRAFHINNKYPEWSKNDCLRIAKQEIWTGMNKNQLVLAWGQPRSIDKNVTYGSNMEQWVYGNLGPFVYIENGIVTSWQN